MRVWLANISYNGRIAKAIMGIVGMQKLIFISHSTKDDGVVDKIAVALEENGF